MFTQLHEDEQFLALINGSRDTPFEGENMCPPLLDLAEHPPDAHDDGTNKRPELEPLVMEEPLTVTAVSSQRRRQQNRVAQKAFRERKETRIKELEDKAAALLEEQRSLRERYNCLYDKHCRLRQSLRSLLEAHGVVTVKG
jgi:hypothetical protein